MSDKLITLQTYPSPMEAELVRGLLESHGIDTFLADESADGYIPTGVRIQILEDDLEEARRIVHEALESQEPAPEETEQTLNEDGCPICGGLRAEPVADPVRSVLGVLLLGFGFFILLAKRRCQICGYVGRW